LWLPPESAPDILRSAGIDPMRRAQTLSLPEWAAVAAAVRAAQAGARDATRTPNPAAESSDVPST
ncbi:MAG: hypothetical protein AB7R89_15365, partial [Dehalococcoidia bacterium]